MFKTKSAHNVWEIKDANDFFFRGVGPSADLMSTSLMSDSMVTSQSDSMNMSLHQSRPEELRSQESFIALSRTESPPRRSSTPRTITVLPAASTHKVTFHKICRKFNYSLQYLATVNFVLCVSKQQEPKAIGETCCKQRMSAK